MLIERRGHSAVRRRRCLGAAVGRALERPSRAVRQFEERAAMLFSSVCSISISNSVFVRLASNVVRLISPGVHPAISSSLPSPPETASPRLRRSRRSFAASAPSRRLPPPSRARRSGSFAQKARRSRTDTSASTEPRLAICSLRIFPATRRFTIGAHARRSSPRPARLTPCDPASSRDCGRCAAT